MPELLKNLVRIIGTIKNAASGEYEDITSTNPLPVGFGSTFATDAGGRLRVSNGTTLFTNKNIQSENPNKWEVRTSGGTETVSHDPATSSVILTIGTAATEFAVRQSTRYITYDPGKSQFIKQTFVMNAAKTNLTQEVGYGDDENGLFAELADGAVSFVTRTNTSGSVADNSVAQADWNRDTLAPAVDGVPDEDSPSGITLDIAKEQLVWFDFLWQGVGTVTFGFLMGDKFIICHEEDHANIDILPFIRTPSLPVRFKIYNTGITSSSSALREICSDVESEGGFTPPGFEFSEGTLVTSRVAVTTRRPIFAIRLKDAFSGTVLDNRRTVKFLDAGFSTTTNDAMFEVVHVHNPSDVTATWADVGGGSGVQYSRNISAVTGSPSHKVDHRFVSTSTGGKADAGGVEADIINEHSFISQDFESNNSQLFVIYATAETGTANCTGHITWLEFE